MAEKKRGRLLIVDDLTAPTRAVDRGGRDVRRDVAAADGELYRSDPRVLAGAHLDDLEDWIDVAIPAPVGADSVAIVLRLRNSLLNTILLYDIMLGDPGARSPATSSRAGAAGPRARCCDYGTSSMRSNRPSTTGSAIVACSSTKRPQFTSARGGFRPLPPW